MGSDKSRRSALALSLLDQFPQSISESLISDSTFRKSFGLKADALISFDDSSLSFQRSKLFKAVREVFTDNSKSPILKDNEGSEWRLELNQAVIKRQLISLSCGAKRFLLPELSALSPNQADRLNGFDREAKEANLSEPLLSEWREKLALGPLEDDEHESLQKDLKNTPAKVAENILSQLKLGSSSVSSLVPNYKRYFYQLVGELKQSDNVSMYSQQEAQEHFLKLLDWRPYDGFLHSLLLASHPYLPSKIRIDQLEEDDLFRAYEWLAKSGDRISQVGAVEIWLSNPSAMPKVETFVRDIIQQVRNDNEENGGRMSLLSALIILVDGELARTKILADKPPFYRRLSSIAHASLIERCIVASKADISHFNSWAMNARGQSFYLQGMADLRSEPRWDPEYVSARQLKAEFTGRIFNAAQLIDTETKESIVRDLLAGDGNDDINSLIPLMFSFLPGPLEGGIESQNDIPPEVQKSIEEQLSAEVLQPTSFAALVNSALFFRIDSNHAQIAAKALRSVKYQIKKGDKKELIFSVLRGLANVAAVTRSGELAEEIRILDRRCRQDAGKALSIEESMWIGLVAAAAYSEMPKWCEFLGEWVTELAFQAKQHEEIDRLHSIIKQLLHIVPELWLTCGRAEAATNNQ